MHNRGTAGAPARGAPPCGACGTTLPRNSSASVDLRLNGVIARVPLLLLRLKRIYSHYRHQLYDQERCCVVWSRVLLLVARVVLASRQSSQGLRGPGLVAEPNSLRVEQQTIRMQYPGQGHRAGGLLFSVGSERLPNRWLLPLTLGQSNHGAGAGAGETEENEEASSTMVALLPVQ